MEVADAHKSIATFYTTVRGLEAHSSKPNLGANAIEGAAALVADLYRFADEMAAGGLGGADERFDPPTSTLSVGHDRGRHGAQHSGEGMLLPLGVSRPAGPAAGYRAPAAQRLCARDRPPPPAPVRAGGERGDHRGGRSAGPRRAARIGRGNPRPEAHEVQPHHRRAYATEAGRFQTAGVPTVVCGPGAIDQAHQPDEYIEAGELSRCIGFMRALAAELS